MFKVIGNWRHDWDNWASRNLAAAKWLSAIAGALACTTTGLVYGLLSEGHLPNVWIWISVGSLFALTLSLLLQYTAGTQRPATTRTAQFVVAWALAWALFMIVGEVLLFFGIRNDVSRRPALTAIVLFAALLGALAGLVMAFDEVRSARKASRGSDA